MRIAFTMVALSFCASCEKASNSSGFQTPIRISQPVIDLGAITSGQRIDHAFQLNVWAKGAATITNIETSCGCMAFDDQIVGMELRAGSRHSLRLSLKTDGLAGYIFGYARIVTDPPAAEPLVVKLTAVVSGVPTVSPGELYLDTELGSRASGLITVHYIRGLQSPELVLDEDASEFGPFEIETVNTDSKLVRAAGAQLDASRHDRVEITLYTEDTTRIGNRSFDIRLRWRSDIPETVVPVNLSVCHPIKLPMDRLFLGEMHQQETRQVYIQIPTVSSSRITGINSSHDFVACSLEKTPRRLVVSVTAPRAPGRFEGMITIQTDSGDLPSIQIPVSGYVPDR